MAQRRSLYKAKTDVMIVSDLASLVGLPPHTDINEWYAVHIVQFYNELSLVCAIIRHDNVICNEHTCPRMSAGLESDYLWHSKEFIQPISVSAPKYIDFLLEWLHELINNHRKFPRINHKQTDSEEEIEGKRSDGACDNEDDDENEELSENHRHESHSTTQYKFPRDFKALVGKMARRMARIFGHIYHAHYQEIVHLNIHTHFNTSFQYFLHFIKAHGLVKEKELIPMRRVIKHLYSTGNDE